MKFKEVKFKEVIDFLLEAENHTYSSEDKFYLSKVIDTLYRMKECEKFKD